MEPFTPRLDAADLADLRDRLRRTRWPDAETGADQGVPLAQLQRLVEHWSHGYDWARLERRLTAAPQVRVPVDGLRHHALHLRSSRPGARPLLLAHGWPSTAYEFLDAARLLAEPDGDQPAFHVVAPSLPGYGWSDKPTEPGWDAARTADAWVGVMERLGYTTFLAHGGDWGAIVTTELALRRPERLTGLHLTMPLARVTEEDRAAAAASPFQARGLEREAGYRKRGYAYALVQHTRPQTLGYALEDSPVGLCAWIAEKLWAWSGRSDDGAPLLTDDAVLDVVSVYWLTRTATSSARLYAEALATDRDRPVLVPTVCSVFADEVLRPPQAAVARRFRELRGWREVPRGGHFPAAEVPDLFAAEVRAAAALLG